jgi:3-hydroxymyristoyl/3-hydroxydecanoyl-(acyl carrier protein) dehydratase
VRAFTEVTIAGGTARATVVPAHAVALCDGHFPGDPLVHGSSLAALMAELGSRLLAERTDDVPVLEEVVRCVFRAPVRPDVPIVVVARGDGACVDAEVQVGGVSAATATLRFAGGTA